MLSICWFCGLSLQAQFVIKSGTPATLTYDESEQPVVHSAISLLERDYKNVFSDALQRKASDADVVVGTIDVGDADIEIGTIDTGGADVVVGTIDKSPLVAKYSDETTALRGKTQAFILKVLADGRLLIAGSDAHGTAYGVMELCRLIGVSPWEWWADATPQKRQSFVLPAEYQIQQSPSVEYRGIFINDEDWGLAPWAHYNHEPGEEYNLNNNHGYSGEHNLNIDHEPGGERSLAKIGPKTNERIFELMLRLRANYFWPAMHECTEPFFLTKGNREMAKRFGIYIGGSHCEPMACSAAVEWGRRGNGAYDYVNNAAEVYRFWENRVKDVAKQEIVYTIGMRGVHDGKMQGAKTLDEQKEVMKRVLHDQRELLRKYVDEDVTKIPQVFIPYKEVLDIYNAGLQVPEDVTLMWCDDNYGYIRHFPTTEERARKGGNGVYYHVSYWGRPHDYLWLGTFSPYLLYQQMMKAYDRGIQKMWILNVGDIKPSEYQIELFLDMAWNIDDVRRKGATGHLRDFLQREFGEDVGDSLLPVMREHYRLAYIRKPEFMGNTRTEESPQRRIVTDLPWSKEYIEQRLEEYKTVSDKVENIYHYSLKTPKSSPDKFFQLVKYPVQAAAQMNNKTLYAQLARHGMADWNKSDAAYDSIVSLTHTYNTGIENEGKWRRMMDHKPRRLAVFEPMTHKDMNHKEEYTPLPNERTPLYRWNATDGVGPLLHCDGLGYEGKAATIPVGEVVDFKFGRVSDDSVEVEIALLPNHPVNGNSLRFSITIDGQLFDDIAYHTKGRSEEWKKNVLSNRAVRRIVLPLKNRKRHKMSIKAIDEGVVLDQVSIFNR